MTTQKLPPEIEELRDEKSEQVGIPHFAKSLSERAGHIATFKDGFEAGALAVLEQADKLAEALKFYGDGNCDHERDIPEILSGELRPKFMKPMTYGEVARAALADWCKFRGLK